MCVFVCVRACVRACVCVCVCVWLVGCLRACVFQLTFSKYVCRTGISNSVIKNIKLQILFSNAFCFCRDGEILISIYLSIYINIYIYQTTEFRE